jgi:hypothetical protein
MLTLQKTFVAGAGTSLSPGAVPFFFYFFISSTDWRMYLLSILPWK